MLFDSTSPAIELTYPQAAATPGAACLHGERVWLRPWRARDLAPFAALNSDPPVFAHLPGPLDRAQSDALAHRFSDELASNGFGFWALELPGVAPFAGFIGLNQPSFNSHFTPCIEVGWRLARPFWGRGYATEAARLAIAFAFEQLALREVVAFTTVDHIRSRRVMVRLGMEPEATPFPHPDLPNNHPLSSHILYRLERHIWQRNEGSDIEYPALAPLFGPQRIGPRIHPPTNPQIPSEMPAASMLESRHIKPFNPIK